MKLAIFGYGGHAREVARQINKSITYFVSDDYANGIAKPISTFVPSEYKMMIAIGEPEIRFNIVQSLPKETQYFTFIHPTALVMDDNIEIGEGSFIGAYSILTTNIKIGKHTILNRGNQIGHDTTVDDYFSAMPGAILSGNVIIGKKVYMGTNSSVKEKISICSSTIIGSNATVVKNINNSGTYVGCPAKLIK